MGLCLEKWAYAENSGLVDLEQWACAENSGPVAGIEGSGRVPTAYDSDPVLRVVGFRLEN